MDPAVKRKLKEQLLEDIRKWQPPEPRGFQDIVRNAIDLDKKIWHDLMKAFDVGAKEVRRWGSGAEVPEDFKRFVIVERIRELLEAELGAVTEVKD